MTTTSSPDGTVFQASRLSNVTPLLTGVHIHKTYGGGAITAVNSVSLTVYPGEILGIVGESGSGKSTLLRMLNFQEEPDSGEYYLSVPDHENENLFTLDRYTKREITVHHIGIVYQSPHLGLRMNNSSSGNVAVRLLIAGERRYEVLREKARVSLDSSEFPLLRMDDPPRNLSGGMQQRVQLAKAIAMKPRLLLLDEPTSGLDVSVQARVLDTLKHLQRETNVTMILVSHDLGVIRTLADRVMVMRNGSVIETGLTDQILEDPQAEYTQQLVHAKL